jgi:hypothetical protein
MLQVGATGTEEEEELVSLKESWKSNNQAFKGLKDLLFRNSESKHERGTNPEKLERYE